MQACHANSHCDDVGHSHYPCYLPFDVRSGCIAVHIIRPFSSLLLCILRPCHLKDPQMCSTPGPACLTGGAAVQMMSASNAWRWPELQKEASMPSHVSSTTPTAPSAQVSTPCPSLQFPRQNPDLSRNPGAQHTHVSGALFGSLCKCCKCLAQCISNIVAGCCGSHCLMRVSVCGAADAAGADAPDAGQLTGLCRQIPWRLPHPQPGRGAAAKHGLVAPLAPSLVRWPQKTSIPQ